MDNDELKQQQQVATSRESPITTFECTEPGRVSRLPSNDKTARLFSSPLGLFTIHSVLFWRGIPYLEILQNISGG